MNIDDARSLVGQSSVRSKYRDALIGVCPLFSDSDPLGALLDAGDVPATKVRESIDTLLGYENMVFRAYIDPERETLQALRDYADKEIGVEKVAIIAQKLVTQAIKAGLKYSAIQHIVVAEMDRRGHDWPNEGW